MTAKSVLLVDPDARTQRVLDVSLRKAGFAVQCATTVEEALAKASATPPDLVITESDLEAKGAGARLAARLREDPVMRESVVLFLSVDASNDAKIRAITAGADEFLAKPILFKDLFGRLAGLLERREQLLLQRRDRPPNFTGTLAGMGLLDLFQLVETGRRSCTLELTTDPQRASGWVARAGAKGQIHFLDGRVVDASTGDLRGEPAVYRMLLWDDADFELSFVPPVAEVTVRAPMQALILEGIRRVDEWARLEPDAPSRHARLLLDLRALAVHAPDVPEEADAVLRLFDGKRALLEILDHAPIEELATIQIVIRAVADHILVEERSPRPGEATSRLSLDDWLSRRPSMLPPPASKVPSPVDDIFAQLPSELGQVMIPSARTLSQLVAPADPIHADMAHADQGPALETARPEPLDEPREALGTDAPVGRARRTHRGAAYRSLRRTSTVAPRSASLPDKPATIDTPPRALAEPPPSAAIHRASIVPAMAEPTPAALVPVEAVAAAAPTSAGAAAAAASTPAAQAETPKPAVTPTSAISLQPSTALAAAPRAPSPPPKLQAPAPTPSGATARSTSLDDDFARLRGVDDTYDDGTSRLMYWVLGGLALVAVVGFLVLPRAAPNAPQPAPNPPVAAEPGPTPSAPTAQWPATPDGVGSATTAASNTAAQAAAVPAPSAAPTTSDAPTPSAAPAATDGALVEAQKLLRKEKFKDARALVEPTLAQADDAAERRAVFAHALYGLGQGAKASDEAKRALELDANNARAHLVLGLVATDQGRNKDATAAFRRYLDLAPNGDYAAELRSFLKTRT